MSTLSVRTRIKTLRETKGISQSQMAERLHMDERNYKRIESGERKGLDVDLLSNIAEILNVDVTDLFTNDSVYIENSGEISSQTGGVSVVYSNEFSQTNHNSIDPELLKKYEDLFVKFTALLDRQTKVIEEKDNTIAANEKLIQQLQELQHK